MLKEISRRSDYPPQDDDDPVKTIEDIGKRLSENKSEMFREQMVAEAFKSIKEVLEGRGWRYLADVNQVYGSFKNENLLVRRENPLRLLDVVQSGQPLKIEFDAAAADFAGEKYANCAEWNYADGGRGLANAFLEGYSSLGNSIVFIVGFRQGEKLKVTDIPADRKLFHNLDRTFVRSAEGLVEPKDLRFVVLRVPASFFPKNQMTEKEIEQWEEETEKPLKERRLQIFRGFMSV